MPWPTVATPHSGPNEADQSTFRTRELAHDLGQKNDGGEGRKALPVLVHLDFTDQKIDSATTGAIQGGHAALTGKIGRGKLEAFRIMG